MGKVFVGQTALDIVATVGQDITGATALLIKYIKPDLTTTGEFNAVISDAATGEITYTVTSENDIDQPGNWKFWAHVTFSDGSYAAGEIYKQKVYTEGT